MGVCEIKFLTIPTQCPYCGGNTVIKQENEAQILFCDNPNCESKLVNKLDHFVSKKGLDIKGLSKATLGKLIDWGWVTTLGDLFTLDKFRADWIEKPGFGAKSVDNILSAITAARDTTLEAYLSAIGIPLIGRTYSRELAHTFGDYEEFRYEINNYFNFAELQGFGPEKHNAIVNFNYKEADRLVDMGIITFSKDEVKTEAKNSLEGKVIVITGKLKTVKNRDELKARIEAAGGKVTGSVSSKTNYLVNNDINSSSSKNVTAKSLGIPIITEEELINMLN